MSELFLSFEEAMANQANKYSEFSIVEQVQHVCKDLQTQLSCVKHQQEAMENGFGLVLNHKNKRVLKCLSDNIDFANFRIGKVFEMSGAIQFQPEIIEGHYNYAVQEYKEALKKLNILRQKCEEAPQRLIA